MGSKLHINASLGLFEVEGSEEFIRGIYEDAKAHGLFAAGKPVGPEQSAQPDVLEAKPDKPKRTATKRTGPGCGSRIAELKTGGFFTELRDPKSIGEALSERGHNYEGKHIAAALSGLTKNGTLRRVKRDGNWMYQQP